MAAHVWKDTSSDDPQAVSPTPPAAPVQRYATSYGEEVRQALGVKDGRVAFFTAPLANNSGAGGAAFSANLGHRGLSLRLDW